MWPYPRILAHRGGGKLAPENTIAGLRAGLSYGFRAVEFDVMLSQDGVGVVMHDPDFGRTVAGRGSVASSTAAELQRMDAGSWYGPQFAGEPVPLFTEFVAFCKANGIWMNIEIKPAPGHDAATGDWVARRTRELFAEHFAAELVSTFSTMGSDPKVEKVDTDAAVPLLSSFSFEALVAAKEAAPEIPRAYLLDKIPDDWEGLARELDAVAIHTNHKHLTPGMAQAIKDAGLGLFCYTVNDPERARTLFDWGVDAFCTDRIDLIGPAFA